jgi:hypothetical protein
MGGIGEDEMDVTESKDKTVEVNVRTPAGHPYEFTFKDHERVSEATREAVRHFVAAGELAVGDYGLALIRDGRSIELAPGARLDDYNIGHGDTLALFNKRPQVDGQHALVA